MIFARCGIPPSLRHVSAIIRPREVAIRLSSNVGTGSVRDNIIAEAGSNPISAPSIVRLTNNRVGSLSQMSFVDPERLNFRLRADSPARNQGGAEFPQTDYDDVARPQDGAPDQGAFEGNGAAATVARPKAPDSLAVE